MCENYAMIHGVFWVIIFAFAIIGGTCVGISDCKSIHHREFCRDDPTFLAGFSFLLLMAFTFVVWVVVTCMIGF